MLEYVEKWMARDGATPARFGPVISQNRHIQRIHSPRPLHNPLIPSVFQMSLPGIR